MRDEKLGIDELGPGGALGDAADHVELALERVLVGGQLVASADEELPDDGREELRGRRRTCARRPGTSRQPSTRWPSAATVCSSSSLELARGAAASRGRKHTATP